MSPWLSDDELVRQPVSREQMVAWRAAREADWSPYILRPEGQALPRSQVGCATEMSGLYGLWLDGGLIYVGKAINLAARLCNHAAAVRFGREHPFDAFTALEVPEYALRDVEVAHIHALEPGLNRQYERPSWVGHDSMVAEIRRIWNME